MRYKHIFQSNMIFTQIHKTKLLSCLGTYKLKKRKLQKEGFDPKDISDPLYFVDHENSTYIPLTPDIVVDIVNGQLKL